MPEHRERHPDGTRGRVERSEFEAGTAAQEHQAPLSMDTRSPTPPNTSQRDRRYHQDEPPHQRSLGFLPAELERADRLATVTGFACLGTHTHTRPRRETR
jgi:hypothetical protein